MISNQSLHIVCNQNCLIIFYLFFQDDVEVSPTCGLGNTQKFIQVYAAFADLPFDQRTQSNDIDVVLMANRKRFNELGIPFAALFELLFSDLKQLMEDGIEVEINGSMVKLDVGLALLICDNSG